MTARAGSYRLSKRRREGEMAFFRQILVSVLHDRLVSVVGKEIRRQAHRDAGRGRSDDGFLIPGGVELMALSPAAQAVAGLLHETARLEESKRSSKKHRIVVEEFGDADVSERMASIYIRGVWPRRTRLGKATRMPSCSWMARSWGGRRW